MNIESRLARTYGESRFVNLSLPHHGSVSLGFETITPGDSYRWMGTKRGGNARRPIWLFQYTLSGWGWFETKGATQRVTAGKAICAQIPSSHGYFNDPACQGWRFFWIMVWHPYVAQRLIAQPNLVNAVIDLPENTPALEAAVALFFNTRHQDDAYDVEAKLFFWLLEMERFAFLQRHPEEEREQLLDFVRTQVLRQLDQFIAVEELGKKWGASRSNFTHHFRKVTGLSPASYIREIRVREAARLLQEQKWSVKEVAAMTGFSDANNLCKCFRAQFQISPGNYRRLMAKR